MASTRDLWIILRGRDEASRTINTFTKNVRSAAMAVRVAQLETQAASIRQRAQALLTNSAMAQQIRAINDTVIGIDKQAKAHTLAAAQAREYRDQIISANIATEDEINQLNQSIKFHSRRAAVLRSEAGVIRNTSAEIKAALDTQVAALNTESEALFREANELRQASIEAKKHEKTLKNLAGGLREVSQTATVMGIAFLVAGGATLAFFKNSVDAAVAYEKQVRATMTQVDGIKVSLKELGDIGIRVADEVAVPLTTLQDTLFFIFSSMKVNLKEAEALLDGFAKEAVAGQTDIASAARLGISILNAYQLPVSELTNLQDVQFQIVRKGIITYEELARTIGRAIPAAARAGQSFKTLGAMVSFLTQRGQSAAMAATAAGRALTSFSNPKVIDRLEKIGIKVRDVRGEFLPLVDVMKQMQDRFKKMTVPARTKFLTELFLGAGGTEQARRFWDTAFNNFDQFVEQIGFMNNATGVFNEEYGVMAGSIAARTQLLNNRWEIMKITIGNILLPVWEMLVSIMSKALDWFNKLPEGTKNIIVKVIALSAALSVLVGVFLLVIGTIAFFISGIVAAGSSLFVVVGALGIISAGFAAFVAAIVLAWNKSAGFRGIIYSLGAAIKSLWEDQVKPIAKSIGESFTKYVLPPLQRLWDLVENKLLPKVQELIDFLNSEATKSAKEFGAALRDNAEKAFKKIGKVIDETIIPALQKLLDWYNEHEVGIKKFGAIVLKIIGFFGGAAVLGAIGAFVTEFTFIANVIGFVVDAFIKFNRILEVVIKWVLGTEKAISDWLTSTSDSMSRTWDTIVNFTKETWEGIKNFFIGLWTSISETARSAWNSFWGMFGGLIKSGWALIQEIFRLGINGIKLPFELFAAFVMFLWNTFWNFLKTKAQEFWDKFGPGIMAALEFVKKIWNDFTNNISSRFTTFKTWFLGSWEYIKKFWSDLWNNVSSTATGVWGVIFNEIKTQIEKIKNFFLGANTWLLDAGKNILQGLIDGIKKKVDDLKDFLKSINKLIEDNKGPKAYDLRMLRPAGQYVMTGFMRGIEDMLPTLTNTLRDVSGLVTAQTQVPAFGIGEQVLPPTSRFVGGAETTTKTVTQNITINTKEINPRTQAAELGFLLAERL